MRIRRLSAVLILSLVFILSITICSCAEPNEEEAQTASAEQEAAIDPAAAGVGEAPVGQEAGSEPVSAPASENEGIASADTGEPEVQELSADEESAIRQAIVNYALSFVGGRYRWGGTDPYQGVDCSGFTSYIMKKILGIDLSHSSRAQSGEGEVVSAEELKPGDLVFYGSGSAIDHVAIYAGDGRIVHASNEKNGIKISDLTARKPRKFVTFLKTGEEYADIRGDAG